MAFLKRNPTRDRRSGLAIVEAALVLPLVILLLFGAVHFAGLFFVQNNMVNAARDAARKLAVGEIGPAQAQSDVQAALADWPAAFDVGVTMPDPSDPDNRDIVVQVTTPVADAGLVDFLAAMQGGDLRATVTMRQE